ncbi:integrase core domain-containing protein [Patescibacteria group bacterium]|nr:integrase core domain-containing protein [Patescibacteria group bacterium]
MRNIAKIRIAWNLWKERVPIERMAKRVKVHRATVYRWIPRFRRLGLRRTIEYYRSCKKRSRRKRKVTGRVKAKVYEIREEKRNCCREKIQYFLRKEERIHLSVKTIYRILNEKYELRKKYKRGRKHGEVPKAEKEREVIQTDTIDFGEVYAFNYIDIYTRQAYVDLEVDLESESGKASLEEAVKVFGKIELLQSDGGPEYKKEFRKVVGKYTDKYRVSRPYKKNEQSYIESFNRSLRKECLGWGKYNIKDLPNMKERVKEYLKYYNNERPHLRLGMQIPNEIATCRICK